MVDQSDNPVKIKSLSLQILPNLEIEQVVVRAAEGEEGLLRSSPLADQLSKKLKKRLNLALIANFEGRTRCSKILKRNLAVIQGSTGSFHV